MADTTPEHETSPAPDTAAEGTPADPADALGDAGKRALQTLRAEVKDLRAELKKYQAPEPADEGQRDAADSADSTSETRDAAPTSDAGHVATTDDDVKPPRPMFQGSGDGGARQAPASARQLTADDLRSMSPRAIDQARREGRLRNLLGGSGR